MIEVMILWIYMILICVAAGTLVLTGAGRIFGNRPVGDNSVTGTLMAGITVLTVYAEFWSIVMKVGMVCHIVMLVLIGAGLFYDKTARRMAAERLKELIALFRSRGGLLYIFIILFLAFCTSRGFYHTDTGIYHAQAIRVIEEYGVVPGIGNLQLHFAYNSSSLVFAALFTMSWILPSAFHGTSGFMMMILSIYAIRGIGQTVLGTKRTVDGKRAVLSAAARMAILFYVLTNAYYAMSPATDYMTMLGVLFLLTAWIEGVEQRESAEYYGLLSVFAVFCVSMKLSSATVVLLALYPSVKLLKEKKIRKVLYFLATGFLVILPYLIRNVIISGWLLYPFTALDLFNPDWKIPAYLIENDAAQIEVWGKCLYDVTLRDYSISEWFPIWWTKQENYEQMLVYAVAIGTMGLLLKALKEVFSRNKDIRWEKIVFYLTLYASLLFWFYKSPFIRYGLSYLLLVPACVIGEFIADFKKSGRFYLTAIGLCSVACVFFLSYWVDAYFTLDMVYAKHYFKEPYYLAQQPFDDPEEQAVDMGSGVIAYYTLEDDNNSYYCVPSTSYKWMMDETEARGTSVKDGFRHKD